MDAELHVHAAAAAHFLAVLLLAPCP
jgi:hypothetical protein